MNIQLATGVSMNWENGIGRFSLNFDNDTTLEDLKHVWSWARKMQRGKQSNKYQPIKNFDRDKRAYELKLEGRSSEDALARVGLEVHKDVIQYKPLLNI